MKLVEESVMAKQVFNCPFSTQPVAWATAFLIPRKQMKQECTAEGIAPRRFCTYKLWNHGLQSIVQYQEALGEFHLTENGLFLLLSSISSDYSLWALLDIRERRLSDQQLQGNTTKTNLKTDRNHHCGCRKGKRRRYSLAVNVMSWPQLSDQRHSKTSTKCLQAAKEFGCSIKKKIKNRLYISSSYSLVWWGWI